MTDVDWRKRPRNRLPALDAPLPATNPEFRAWRLRLGLSQPAAAAALGYSTRAIGTYDRGDTALDADGPTLALAMEALESREIVAGIAEWRRTALAIIHRLINHLSADDLLAANDLTALAHDIANLEGWGLYAVGKHLEIQRDDEANVFLSDGAALEYVKRKAQIGSTLHGLATSLHRRKIEKERAALTLT